MNLKECKFYLYGTTMHRDEAKCSFPQKMISQNLFNSIRIINLLYLIIRQVLEKHLLLWDISFVTETRFEKIRI